MRDTANETSPSETVTAWPTLSPWRGSLQVSDGEVSFEVSRIGATPAGFAYVAQPGGAPPTAFVLAESGPSRAVFSNPENDFPTRVIYERSGDTLKARIEGEIDGRARSMEWNFAAAPLITRCPA